MTPRAPDPFAIRPARRLVGALAVGAVVANVTDISEIHPVAGAGRVAVHIKSTAAGTLKLHYMGPDTDLEASPTGAIGTEYTAGNPTDVAVTANTDAVISDASVLGQAYVKIIFTGGAAGVITYVDFSQLT